MKKFTFYQSMAASWVAAVALAVALSAGLSACDKDEDNGSDAEPYKPSKDMTHEQILALFKEVNDNMATVRQMSVEETKKDDVTENGKTTTSTGSGKVQANLDAKKELILEYKAGDGVLVVDEFTYIEDSIAYYYESDEPKKQRSYKVSDAYWNHCKVFDSFRDFGDFFESVSEWKVEGDAFVGSATEGGETRKYTVSLTSSKKISSIKYEYGNTKYRYREYEYTYSANPTFPSDYSDYKESKFPLAEQYSVKVVWGEGLGESTFYAEMYSDDSYSYYFAVYYPDEIIRYAPKVSGKKPTLYSDKECATKLEEEDYPYWGLYGVYVLSGNTVIYVKWVDE
jgi:hypothetical protein